MRAKQRVLKENNSKCFYCEAKFTNWMEFGIDHVIPKNNDLIVLACRSCNSSKWAYTLEEWKKRIEARLLTSKVEINYCKKVLKNLKKIK